MEPAQTTDEEAPLKKERRDSSDDNDMDCQVCLSAFDEIIQRPRTLPCGHTFCTPCMNGIKGQGQIMCPTCREMHTVPEGGQFPISYVLERFIKKLRITMATTQPGPGKDTGDPPPSQATGSDQTGPEGLSRSIRSMLQNQKSKILNDKYTCQKVKDQLNMYQKTLISWSERQQQLEDELQTLVDNSKNARVLSNIEKSKVADKKEQLQHGEEQLDAQLQELLMVTTDEEFGVKFVDVVRRTDEERQRVLECPMTFPDLRTVTNLNKVEMISRAARKAAKDVEGASAGAEEDPNLHADPASTIAQRLHALLAPTLETKDLRTLTQPTRDLLQANRVFATHKTEGRSRYGRITVEDGRLYLHSLQDKPPTPDVVILQMEEVVPASLPCLVFLDLEWPGSEARRVLIQLSSDTPMSRQFVLLCTGQRGPCYANTKLYKVHHKGHQGEWVGGGDYDKNNGKGGDALLPNLDKGEYRQSKEAGVVCRVNRNVSDWNTRFGIYTKDNHCSVSGVFGKVVSGLEIVAAAAQHSPIKEVTVVDCGVVLLE